MRWILGIVLVCGTAGVNVASVAPAAGDVAAVAGYQPGEPTPIEPTPVTRTEWEEVRIWFIVGAIALVLVAVGIFLAARGGGRTVLKE